MIGNRRLIYNEMKRGVENDIFSETTVAYHRVLWKMPLKSTRPKCVLASYHRGKNGPDRDQSIKRLQDLICGRNQVIKTVRILNKLCFLSYTDSYALQA